MATSTRSDLTARRPGAVNLSTPRRRRLRRSALPADALVTPARHGRTAVADSPAGEVDEELATSSAGSSVTAASRGDRRRVNTSTGLQRRGQQRFLPRHQALLAQIIGFEPKPSVQPNGRCSSASSRPAVVRVPRGLGVTDAGRAEKRFPVASSRHRRRSRPHSCRACSTRTAALSRRRTAPATSASASGPRNCCAASSGCSATFGIAQPDLPHPQKTARPSSTPRVDGE